MSEYASAITAGTGKLIEGRQASAETDRQREAELFNLAVAQQNAEIVAQQTSAREEQSRRDSRQVLGAQRAGIAQANVGFGGSQAQIIRQSTTNAELDALNIRYAGDLERTGILNEIAVRQFNIASLEQESEDQMNFRWFNAASAFAAELPDTAIKAPTVRKAYGT